MSFRYGVIGSGRQGTAAAYDMGRFGEAERIFMADKDPEQARRAAERVDQLLEARLAEPVQLDASRPDEVINFLERTEIDVFLSAVPYFLNLGLTRAAIQTGCGMTDLGGNSQVVTDQLELARSAQASGAAIVPDCGQVPGMGTSLILYALEHLSEAEHVYMWDCGLPQNPRPPWNYSLTFAIDGLTNEYYGDCLFIREGKLTPVPALTERETIDFGGPIGTLEGFTTAGGLTTAARSMQGRLQTLQNKTLRYPGHFDQLKVIEQLGLLQPEPVQVGGHWVSPRQVLHVLWDPQIRADAAARDFILIHIHADGRQNGRATRAVVQLHHTYDEVTGFTAMEQGTGWHASIFSQAIARGEIPPGVTAVEDAMLGSDFVGQARRRGFEVQARVEFLD